VPFSEPFRPQEHIDDIRKVGRLAQLLLDLRAEYEQKPRRLVLEQMIARLDEITALRPVLEKAIADLEPAPVNNGATPPAE
jgi:hypothetical protein